jgi:hypothetical protein
LIANRLFLLTGVGTEADGPNIFSL